MDSPDMKGPVLDKFHRDLNFINKCLGTFPTIERFIRNDDQTRAAGYGYRLRRWSAAGISAGAVGRGG